MAVLTGKAAAITSVSVVGSPATAGMSTAGRMATYSEWIPGGLTSGGIPEVILEHVPNDVKNIEIIFSERK